MLLTSVMCSSFSLSSSLQGQDEKENEPHIVCAMQCYMHMHYDRVFNYILSSCFPTGPLPHSVHRTDTCERFQSAQSTTSLADSDVVFSSDIVLLTVCFSFQGLFFHLPHIIDIFYRKNGKRVIIRKLNKNQVLIRSENNM